MGDKHPDAESGGEGAVQEGGDGGVLGHVLPALLEALGEAADHVLVVLQQRLEHEVVLHHVLVTQDLGEVIEDVESSDVEFVDCQNGWVAAHNEREIPEELNMRNRPGMTLQTDLKLAILCATLMGSSLWRYWALRRASCFLSAVMEAYLGMTSIRTEDTEGQE